MTEHVSAGRRCEIKVLPGLASSGGSEGESTPFLSLSASGGGPQSVAFFGLWMHTPNPASIFTSLFFTV